MSGIYNYNILVYLTFRAGEPEPESELVGAVFFCSFDPSEKKTRSWSCKKYAAPVLAPKKENCIFVNLVK